MQNIGDRKQAEALLRKSEERLRLATVMTNTGIWDLDSRTGQVYFSPSWKQQIGYEDHEIPNRVEEWLSRLHPDSAQLLATTEAFKVNPWPNYEVEYRLRHKDGAYRWILSKASIVRDGLGARAA